MNNIIIGPSLPAIYYTPTIVTWNRLEPRPRTAKFDRSLRAEVRDALWMLTRQWQFGEFKGEDAGTALFAKIKLETTKITRFANRNMSAVAYDDSLPLETRVEREKIPVDIFLRLRMGHHWFRMLQSLGLNSLRELYRAAYPIEIPKEQNVENARIFSNRQVWQIYAAASGRAMDGWEFYSKLATGSIEAGDVAANGSRIADPAVRSKVTEAGKEFVKYFQRLFSQPEESDDSTWAPEHLEYQFACSTPEPNGSQTVLIADEYYHGHLDWYAFDIHPDPKAQLKEKDGQNLNDGVIKEEIITFLPTEVRFAGMPNVRWWEFEDRKTDFGDIDAHTTDIAKLLFAEFGLIYGNDWRIIPYVVPVGSLCEIKGLVVTDVFGQRTLIKAAGSGEDEDWQRWTMFNLNTRGDTGQADNRLFLPPTVGKLLECPPIEKVTFLRDEMANMVWAVESTIPNNLGSGVDGYETATDLKNYLKRIADQSSIEEPALIENDALIRYLLATTVPYNWIPLIPVHIDNSNREIQLRRAEMPPLKVGMKIIHFAPRGDILNPDLEEKPHYNIFEEEVPRAGAIVTRTYQRTRWHNGTTYLWLGRRKTNGRGEGSSGLKFDQIGPKEKGESEDE